MLSSTTATEGLVLLRLRLELELHDLQGGLTDLVRGELQEHDRELQGLPAVPQRCSIHPLLLSA